MVLFGALCRRYARQLDTNPQFSLFRAMAGLLLPSEPLFPSMPRLLYPPIPYIGPNGEPRTKVSEEGKKYILDTCKHPTSRFMDTIDNAPPAGAPLSDPFDMDIRQRLMVETGGSKKQIYMIIYQHHKGTQNSSHHWQRSRQVSKKRACKPELEPECLL